MKTPTGDWHIKLSNGLDLAFWSGSPDRHPFESEPLFDRGDAWSIDACGREDLPFPVDPAEDSFVLIPKTDVVNVYFKAYNHG
jgi:hypothetical protein